MSRRSIEVVAGCRSPHLERAFDAVTFTLIFTVSEGLVCRFASSVWSDPALTPVAADLAAEIGYKTIEHAARKQVVVRCRVPKGDAANASCEIDRGSGFIPLPVSDEEANG